MIKMNNRMKKSKGVMALLIVTVMILTAMIPLQAFAAAKMSDVSGSWAEKEITAWVDKGFINGYPDGTFKPGNNITRAEFVALVNRVFKFSETAPVTFKDVKDTDWFSKDVALAEKAGYLSELKDGSFILRENIKRQEVAAIIYKLKALSKDEKEAETFTDAAKIPASFKGLIGAVKKAGFMQGYPDGKFDPDKNLTRAEAVVSINNITGIMIGAIAEQTAYINSSLLVNIKTEPSDTTLSAKSSDEAVLKVEITGRYVKVMGLKEGSATVTVTAKKEQFIDKDISFTVNVKKNTSSSSGGGGGGGGGSTTPSNSAPTITVVEPDGVNDKVITLIKGTAFTAPTVTAYDAEDGNITNSIVKTGEGDVDVSSVGEYILTYNVKDSKGLAAAEVKITVKVIADVPDHKVDILDSVVPGEKLVYVTMLGNADGSQWRVFVKKGDGRVELEYNAAKNRFEGATYVSDAKAENVTFEKRNTTPVEEPDYTVNILDSVVPGEKLVYVTFTEGCDGSLWKVFVKKGNEKVELEYNAEKNRFQGATYIADAVAENVTLEKKQPPIVEEPDYTVDILDSVVPGEKLVYVTFAEGFDGSLWKVFVKKGDSKVELKYNTTKNRFQGDTFLADAKAENVTLEKK